MNSAGDSTRNSDSDVTPSAPPYSDTDAEVENSSLDRQVDAAFRDVEDMLVNTRETGFTRVSEFDWSTPNLLAPQKAEEVDHSAPTEEKQLANDPAGEPAYELPAVDSDEAEIREFLTMVERRLVEIGQERQHTESRLLIKLEAEAAVQAAAIARRREEEELRRHADDEAAVRRLEDDLQLKTQSEQVNKAESELKNIWAEERRLRSEAVRLNQTVQELLQKRARAEDDAKLALLTEAQRARDEAHEIHLEMLARLHSEEEALRRSVTRFGLRRTELEHERQKHETDTRKFEEEKARLAAAASARLAEKARLRNEAEERLRLDGDQLQAQEVELAQLTAALAQRRAELDVARRNAEEDAQRLAEARARMDAAADANQQTERERIMVEAQILQRAETERQLLEDVRSRAAEQQKQLEINRREREERGANRIAELEALRIEAESNAQLHNEKEQILASELESLRQANQAAETRLEELDVQRSLAVETNARMLERLRCVEDEAHARAAEEGKARLDLERRIKEETENLRRLELDHQQRIDEEISRRVEAEKRLLEAKNRYQSEQAERIKAELQFDQWNEPASSQPETGLVSTVSKANQEPATVSGYQVGNLSSLDHRLRADAVTALARMGSEDAYDLVVKCFDDESSLVRNAAARAMLILESQRPVESFTRALKDAGPERSARIGKAISESGLATQAIDTLSSEDREVTYNGLCLLFAMAKTGHVEPLVQAIETHAEAEVRLAAIRLLKLSGHEELSSAAVERRLKTKSEARTAGVLAAGERRNTQIRTSKLVPFVLSFLSAYFCVHLRLLNSFSSHQT
jgi:hypothetical protein